MDHHFRIVVANARGVADRWRLQYCRDGKWTITVSGDSEAVYNKLCSLGHNPPIAKVAEVIGNKSWSYLTCACCSESVSVGASFDDNIICEDCAGDMHKAMAGPSE